MHPNRPQSEKQPYARPVLENIGKVVDLTQTGLSENLDDAKQGTVGSKGV